MKHLFENTLYINLDSRPDRNESALKEFAKMGITPATVIQNKGYSDISKSEVDHSSSLLNTKKGL
jgi:hypothetical protein